MGIKGLTKLIAAKSSASILERPISHYHGRIIGIDSYMLMYQFLVAMRGHSGAAFTDQSGDDSMHLYGIFHRTIKFMESGIFPLYVFDGEAPNMKSETLEKRGQSRKDAEEGYERAKEEGNEEDMKKFSKRNIKVSTKHVEEVKTLLTHMGIPYFEAPGEAEAQCAQFQKSGIVYAVASEDLDTLTFGSSLLLRNFNAKDDKKSMIKEINLNKFLSDTKFSSAQFIDLCILLGCDYCQPIKKIGPTRAFSLLAKYRSIEAILENLESKYKAEEDWQYKKARELFENPNVDTSKQTFKWNSPDEEAIIEFLVKTKNFKSETVKNGVARLRKSINKPPQTRIDSFFKQSPAKLNKT